MNVYIEGGKSEFSAPIVLLSGSGVASPIYDYKALYSKLTDQYRVVVVEKFGYGYSDRCGRSRDVAKMVDELRAALAKAGICAPYRLMPHSMSALEAIYWANAYPGEVLEIIGLDMAVPASYEKSNLNKIRLMKCMTFFGFHRIPAFCSVSHAGLTDDEYEQNRLLVYRNSLNVDVYHECAWVYRNARAVGKLKAPDVPMLMFTTNLNRASGSERWVKAQTEYAKMAHDCTQILLDCGHNLQYDQPEYVAGEIRKFLENHEGETIYPRGGNGNEGSGTEGGHGIPSGKVAP